MAPNAALCFILLGTALWLTNTATASSDTSVRHAFVARLFGFVTAFIAAPTLFEYITGLSLEFDTWPAARDTVRADARYSARMAPLTAVALLFLGLAVAFLQMRRRTLRHEAPWLAVAAAVVAYISILGYVFGAPVLYQVASFPAPALLPCVVVFIFSIGALLARPSYSFMATILSGLDGGHMARRMLPFAIALPIVLGGLRTLGERAGRYDTDVSLSILVTANVIAFAIAIAVAARSLNRADAERRRVEALTEGQRRVLEMITQGAPLPQTLDALVRLIDTTSEDIACSILLLEADTGRLRHGAAPRLPESYIHAIDDLQIGPQMGSCGTAAYRREHVFVQDIATDPLWADYKHLALEHDLRACWSTPIFDSDGKVIGTFAIYHRRPSLPNKDQLRAVELATYTAAICIIRHRTEKDLRDSELRFRQIAESLPQLVWTSLPDGNVDYFGPQWTEYTGVAADQQLGFRWIDRIHPSERDTTLAAWKNAIANDTDLRIENRICGHNGTYRWFDTHAVRLRDNDGRVVKWFGSNTDITERKQTEDVRMRSQKIEAMGTLAGGIAHDFNNILLAINGHTRHLEEELPAPHPARESVAEIAKAAWRAADLVRRILAFSRQQDSKHEIIALRPVVEEALQLIRSTSPAMIEIRTDLWDSLPPVAADSGQIHQIVVNLAMNAAHALGARGGVIEVRLDTLQVDAYLAATLRDVQPGHHVRLVVADNGCGMDRATLGRIFDPFFTTKPAGQGTGLGLSIVHGIMKSCRGAVTVYSQPDKGTTFQLYFPVATGKPEAQLAAIHTVASTRGEHVMYVDDEEPLVRLALRVLTRLGYRVTGHTDPVHALEEFLGRPREFDAIITDVAMPGMSGFDLTQAVLATRPDIPIIMTSGYVRKEDEELAQRLGVREIILKPNTLDELGTALKRLFSAA